MMGCTRRLALALGLWMGATSCGGMSQAAAPASGAPGAAAGGAVAAAVVFAVAGGCKLRGCPYGSYCNRDTGFCVAKSCAEGCPANTVCNEGLNRCQERPMAQPPNDFLPQDDARNLPGQN